MTTDVTQRPLPAVPATDISGHADRISAYTIILRAEEEAQNPQDVMSARVVGFMLLEFHKRAHIFGDLACSTLTKWITSPPRKKGPSDRDVVYELGVFLREKFIRLFRTSTTTRYQPPSSHPSRPSFDTLEDMIRDTLERTDRRQTSSRQKALARDGFRCMVTGIFNRSSVRDCPSLLDRARHEGSGTAKAVIETAHILNESTMHGIDPEGSGEAIANKTEYAATAMAMLEAFGFSRFTEAFRRSGGVHEVWNLLSLEHNLRTNFDSLDLWFEHTEKPGRYSVCVSDQEFEEHLRGNLQRPRRHVAGAPMFVEFTSQANDVPAPDPLLLALHATCARVAHMSGAAEHFDKLEDEEDIEILAHDGSSAALLTHLLSPLGALEAESFTQTIA